MRALDAAAVLIAVTLIFVVATVGGRGDHDTMILRGVKSRRRRCPIGVCADWHPGGLVLLSRAGSHVGTGHHRSGAPGRIHGGDIVSTGAETSESESRFHPVVSSSEDSEMNRLLKEPLHSRSTIATEPKVAVLQTGTHLYRRSFKRPTPTFTGSSDSTWSFFALEPSYGSDDTYGPIRSKWTLRRDLRLLDISTTASRKFLANHLNIDPDDIGCDAQYDGGASNQRVHNLLRPAVQHFRLDGTIIREERGRRVRGAAKSVCYSRPLSPRSS